MPKQAAKKTPQKPSEKVAAKKVAAKAVPAKSSPKKAAPAKSAKPSPIPATSEPTHSQIAEQAHHLWQQHGSHHGAHVEHWLQAEQKLKSK